MCCTIITINQAAMATTQVARTIQKEVRPEQPGEFSERGPVRMNWVVVTDHNGSRQLRIQWQPVER